MLGPGVASGAKVTGGMGVALLLTTAPPMPSSVSVALASGAKAARRPVGGWLRSESEFDIRDMMTWPSDPIRVRASLELRVNESAGESSATVFFFIAARRSLNQKRWSSSASNWRR